MIPPSDVDRVRKQSEASIAQAIASGIRPRLADVLILHLLKPQRTLGQRMRKAAFPLAVVAIAFVLMLAAAFRHPPTVQIRGELEVTNFALQVAGYSLGQDKLEISSFADGTPIAVFGYADADLADCVNTLGPSRYRVMRASLSVLGPAKFLGQFDRRPTTAGQDTPNAFVSFESDTSMSLELARATLEGKPGGACVDTDTLRLRPEGELVEIVVGPVVASELAYSMFLPSLRVINAQFSEAGHGTATQRCAIRTVDLSIVQRIPFLEMEREQSQIVPDGTCLDFKATDHQGWDMRLSATSTGFLLRFDGTALPSLDDGKRDTALLSTYLEILMDDPTLGGIFGATVFILTTLWGVATFIRELWT